MADGFERCYSKALAPRRDFEAKLRARRRTTRQSAGDRAAVKDGTLPQPPKG
jgi:hypothetical protein